MAGSVDLSPSGCFFIFKWIYIAIVPKWPAPGYARPGSLEENATPVTSEKNAEYE